ncbi:MAG: ABC transporter permease [Erysipelotrichaceae bacterium]|nr:ABC transporter permease [Erysipelotrichaceae bacterium]
MFKRFYHKIAIDNIKHNKELFLPYIITWSLTIMMYYILLAITYSPELSDVGGGDEMRSILNFGCMIIAIFSIIFLFYTNSFIIKKRKKEISLYNVLGLDKYQISLIMIIENIYIGLFSLIVGILIGYLFSKLVFVILLKLLKASIVFDFNFSMIATIITVILFFFVFILVSIFNIYQIMINDPVNLLIQSKAGEKEPKTKWISTIIGVITLGTGYFIAQTITDPISALGVFFIAVVLVMIGTYLLFTTVSITFLKHLKSKHNFYYNSKHFPVISGMIYRMKQNAVGLANICILSTMVLVTIATTASLYFGQNDALKQQYPYDIVYTTFNQNDQYNTDLLNEVYDLSDAYHIELVDFVAFEYIERMTLRNGNKIMLDQNEDYDSYCDLMIIALDYYNAIAQSEFTLDDNEIITYLYNDHIDEDNLILFDKEYTIIEELDQIKIKNFNSALISTIDKLVVIINDPKLLFENIDVSDDQISFLPSYMIGFNVDDGAENIDQFYKMALLVKDNLTRVESKDLVRQSFYSLYSGLLFIGIFLGLLFLLATALIIYYKQISEGYDDKQKYQIMSNVGMTNGEITSCINYQIKLVFYLPIILACIHLIFAFKIITKLLALFGLVNIKIFLLTSVITVIIYMILYFMIYKLTTITYKRIIS